LVAVEPTSLALLECAKTGDRSGVAWEKVLQRFSNLEFVVSDGALGIAKGVQKVATTRAARPQTRQLEHGLDVFHTGQGARRVLAGPWHQAEVAWEKAEAAEAQMLANKRQGLDARGAATASYRAWKQAESLLAEVDQQETAWQRARAALVVFHPDGMSVTASQ
jgi:predicted P-loop ATPase